MIKRALWAGIALAALTGCKPVDGMEGVWRIALTPDTDPADPEVTIDENFINANAPKGKGGKGGEWKGDGDNDFDGIPDETNQTFAEIFSLLQIIDGDTKEEATAIWQGTMYPCTRKEKRMWECVRDFSTSEESTETHESGYFFTAGQVNDATVTLMLEWDKSTDTKQLAGSMTSSGSMEQYWSETDEWVAADFPNANPPLPNGGQINTASATYLTEDVGGNPADPSNYQGANVDPDCNGQSCDLSVTTTGTTSATFVGEATEFAEDQFQNSDPMATTN